MTELLVILAVALLVLGPKRLPELASGLGKAIREFRKATRDLTDQIEVDESVRKPIMELKAALRDEPMPVDKAKVEAGAIAVNAVTAPPIAVAATPTRDDTPLPAPAPPPTTPDPAPKA